MHRFQMYIEGIYLLLMMQENQMLNQNQQMVLGHQIVHLKTRKKITNQLLKHDGRMLCDTSD